MGALLHDIGKLGIDDSVLMKPGRLTSDEYALIQHHTIIGAELLRAVPSLAAVAPIVRAHHERLDGNGYPDRLVGDAIPLEARIVAVCDAYDAISNTRHYRQGMGHDRAIAILHEHSGTQWDTRIVETVANVTARDPVGIFDTVGHADPACSCADALPESVQTLLATLTHG